MERTIVSNERQERGKYWDRKKVERPVWFQRFNPLTKWREKQRTSAQEPGYTQKFEREGTRGKALLNS